jgi:chloramphenicol-sensitive protein RarD
MNDTRIGLLAMIGTCTIWGLSPIFYKELVHLPAPEVMAHRVIWSFVFFAGFLMLRGRLAEMRAAVSTPRRFGIVALAAAMISVNWFLFIVATQIGRNTEASLGYYIYPLVAVLIGRFVLSERLGRWQWLAIALACGAVLVLTLGLGRVPWIALALALSFGLYGLIKKGLATGPTVSVTCEVAIVAPFAAALLLWQHGSGQGGFGASMRDSTLLILSGPLTAVPLILFAAAARRLRMSTIGVMQYLNPTLQFLCAVLVFLEPFTATHLAAFAMIWTAVAIYSLSAIRQDRAARKASIASAGVGATSSIARSEGSAKP